MPEPSQWTRTIERDPEHSHRYAARWRTLAAQGHDLDGEARFIDAMLERSGRVLDAGCGTGRVGAALATRGHTVVGVDVDPTLIDYARQDHPDSTWVVADLAEFDLRDHGVDEPFDVIVAAGNVMGFLAPSTRLDVLANLKAHLAPAGRLVVGFGAGRGYPLHDYLSDVTAAGMTRQAEFSTWQMHPFSVASDFLVSIAGE